MDVDVALLGVAMVGIVVGLCMVMVVDVGMGTWGEENRGGGGRGEVQVEPSMCQHSNFKVQL